MKSLTLDHYFSDSALKSERNWTLDDFGGYVGLACQIPNVNDYYVLPHSFNTFTVVKTEKRPRLMSNLCLHRGHPLLPEGSNLSGCITCPAHKWTYSAEGRLLSSPGVQVDEGGSLSKGTASVFNWAGFLSTDDSMISSVSELGLRFEDYLLIDYSIRHYDGNWKVYVEIFNDNYHIPAIHPGFRTLVDQKSVKTQSEENFYLCEMAFNDKFYDQRECILFQNYANCLREAYGRKSWASGAKWVTLYPCTMLEFYQDFLMVVVVSPRTPTTFDRHCWVFARGPSAEDKQLQKAFIRAVDKTEDEDAKVVRNISSARLALWQLGREQENRWSHPLEQNEGFHRFLLKNVTY